MRKTREPRIDVDSLNVFNFLRIGRKAPSTNALLLGMGSSSAKETTATAGKNFIEFRLESTATSGDSRGIYNRLYLKGAGVSGESLRVFTSIDDVAAATAHGAHISLNFQSTGEVTGLGVAMRATLHVPDDATWAPGTIAAIQAEIWSDGAASDPDGATEISLIRVVNGGNASGIADVDDDADLLALSGFTIGAGNMVQADVDETKFSHKIRINVGGTEMFLMAADS